VAGGEEGREKEEEGRKEDKEGAHHQRDRVVTEAMLRGITKFTINTSCASVASLNAQRRILQQNTKRTFSEN